MSSSSKQEKKSTRVLISLPKKFLDAVDYYADLEQRSRSELIREALRLYLRGVDTESLPEILLQATEP
jgi:metal-responsive CopG/Arc/MetJ family transcriptional regulator